MITPDAPLQQQQQCTATTTATFLNDSLKNWLLVPNANAVEDESKSSKPLPPTNAEIKLLREGLGALYGERDAIKAENLLSKAIQAWERQAPDERAALYRVRGDCYMGLLKAEEAIQDFTIALDLLNGPGGELADANEIPDARLGRARAILGSSQTVKSITKKELFAQAANDYQIALRLSSKEDWMTDEEKEEDGAARNPYATWEWGIARRGAGDSKGAYESHKLAARAFQDIGDIPRSVISSLDAGIDLAGANNAKETRSVLEKAIDSTTSVKGNDVDLLQRVIAKECEARIALASILWTDDKSAAEIQLGEACVRLDQLNADTDARFKKQQQQSGELSSQSARLSYTIDDIVGGSEASCSRYKNEKFVSETLLWSESLQEKVAKLNKLSTQ